MDLGELNIVWIWVGQKSYGFGCAQNRTDLGGHTFGMELGALKIVWIWVGQKSYGFGWTTNRMDLVWL